MVSQVWESRDKFSHLNNNDIKRITRLWERYLTTERQETLHRNFCSILGRLLQQIDRDGVVFGTIKDLEQTTGASRYILVKNFTLLAKYDLLFKRNGILVVNVKAFDEEALEVGAEDFFE